MHKNNKQNSKILSGLSWSFGARLAGNLGQLIVYFMLARILEPADFGIMAAIVVFVNIANLFATAGLGSAYIQCQNLGPRTYPTFFYIAVSFGLLIYAILFITAPYLSDIFGYEEGFSGLLRIFGITALLTSINAIQISELSKRLDFRMSFYCQTIPSLISGVASILFAFFGFGVYALILNAGISSLISIVMCIFLVSPIPKILIDKKIAKSAIGYSIKLFSTNLLDELYRSIYIVLIGRNYGPVNLGYYNTGRQIPGFLTATINATVASVIFPVFSSMQSNRDAGKIMLRKSIRALNFLIFPMVSILIVLPHQIISILLTDKWIPSVLSMQMFSVILGLHHVGALSNHYMNAMGHASTILRYEVVKKLIGCGVLALTMFDGVESILLGQLFVAVISLLINAVPVKKFINYTFIEQVQDFAPYFILNFVLIFISKQFINYITDPLISVAVVTFSYPILYLTISKFYGFPAFKDMSLIWSSSLIRFKVVSNKSKR